MAEKFLNDNGLHQAYINYTLAMNKPNNFFQQHPSDIEMIVEVKQSLLSLSHNRFRRALPKKSKSKSTSIFSRFSRDEKNDLEMVINACERENSTLDDNETREMFDENEADDVIAERKRLSKLFTKVLTILK